MLIKWCQSQFVTFVSDQSLLSVNCWNGFHMIPKPKVTPQLPSKVLAIRRKYICVGKIKTLYTLISIKGKP